MRDLVDSAIAICAAHWLDEIARKKREKEEMDRLRILYNAGLIDKLPRMADGRTIMQLLDEEVCGFCGVKKKPGEWCDNLRCDSQLRRKR